MKASEFMFVNIDDFEGIRILPITISYDERGKFRRIYDAENRPFEPIQISFSSNIRAGTLRGLHYLEPQKDEYKIVECVSGSIFDVIVDCRKDSSNYLNYTSLLISAQSKFALLIPPGFAHGYLTMQDNSSLIYQMSSSYDSTMERGLYFNDPSIGIKWPQIPTVISQKDSSWPLM